MSITKNNHYVPQWYQEGFFEPNDNSLCYLDLTPKTTVLADGRSYTDRAFFKSPTSRCFSQEHLYSTFFGTTINDEIERRLFGDIDVRGARAVRAFQGADQAEWHRHFQTLFEFIDIQKIRTPKGLDWLRSQYPKLSQNDLMMEMQGIRMMHCGLWMGAVREIVSAEDADTKFIITDHPVTIYNHGLSPTDKICDYPEDPSLVLKGSQTLFPLSRDFCLILSNLEYARDPASNPVAKRTFARKFHNGLVRTDAFIKTRKLTSEEVEHINLIMKKRARRYIAAGRKEWLYPENSVSVSWSEMRKTLLPPKGELWHFGGEMFVRYESGDVHYQDELGRSERERPFLKKELPLKPLKPNDDCGCGMGFSFGHCCSGKPIALRPTWNERSIRERNLMFYTAIVNVLELHDGRDWLRVRRELTDEKISKIYSLYEGLWPLETDIFQLLPKPDGSPRAVYTGNLHPTAFADFVPGASLYFCQLLVQHPFIHAGAMNKKYSPVEHPSIFRQEFLKSTMLFLDIMPLVEVGLVNLVPDPCDFDMNLKLQMHSMSKERTAGINVPIDRRSKELMKSDSERSLLSMPDDLMRAELRKRFPDISNDEIDLQIRYITRLRENDPLSVLQPWNAKGDGDDSGQFNMSRLVPNFELAMYLAQATGSSIVTDSNFRWAEIKRAIGSDAIFFDEPLNALKKSIESSTFAFLQNPLDVIELNSRSEFSGYPKLMRDAYKYCSSVEVRGIKANYENGLNSQFNKLHSRAQKIIEGNGYPVKNAKISCVFPSGGIQDNTINRLLLMSNSETYTAKVPMAFYIN